MLLEPSEHRRRLNDVDMIMKMARKTITCSPDQVFTALRMLPDVIGLQKRIDDCSTKEAKNSETYGIEHLLC